MSVYPNIIKVWCNSSQRHGLRRLKSVLNLLINKFTCQDPENQIEFHLTFRTFSYVLSKLNDVDHFKDDKQVIYLLLASYSVCSRLDYTTDINFKILFRMCDTPYMKTKVLKDDNPQYKLNENIEKDKKRWKEQCKLLNYYIDLILHHTRVKLWDYNMPEMFIDHMKTMDQIKCVQYRDSRYLLAMYAFRRCLTHQGLIQYPLKDLVQCVVHRLFYTQESKEWIIKNNYIWQNICNIIPPSLLQCTKIEALKLFKRGIEITETNHSIISDPILTCMKPWEMEVNTFEQVEVLYEKTYCIINKVTCKETNKEYVEKKMSVPKTKEKGFQSEEVCQFGINEINLALKLMETYEGDTRLEHVFKPLYSYYKNGAFYTVMKLYGCDLDDYRLYLKTLKDPNDLLNMTKQLLDALSLFEDADLIHRDIKPNNIFIDVTPLKVAICDFGLMRWNNSKYIHPYFSPKGSQSSGGVYPYVPPETIPKVHRKEDMYLHESDIWSLGVILSSCIQNFNGILDRKLVCSLNSLKREFKQQQNINNDEEENDAEHAIHIPYLDSLTDVLGTQGLKKFESLHLKKKPTQWCNLPSSHEIMKPILESMCDIDVTKRKKASEIILSNPCLITSPRKRKSNSSSAYNSDNESLDISIICFDDSIEKRQKVQ
jgi:serine/threonine protein kinase